MTEETERDAAFAHFDALKGEIDALHGHAARLGDADLTSTAEALHTKAQAAWTSYLEARGWETEAGEANRSGGEDKPPKDEEEPPAGGGG